LQLVPLPGQSDAPIISAEPHALIQRLFSYETIVSARTSVVNPRAYRSLLHELLLLLLFPKFN
jgi:hypothetical protein